MKKCDNEEKLIAEALKGNTLSFGELVRHYESFVFNVSYSYMGNYDDAFDTAQDAFIKAWRKLSTFKGESSFSTWLYRITANTAKDALKQRAERWKEAEVTEQLPSEQETPEESAVKNEELSQLRSALASLEPEFREIIILREFDGLSYTELSEHLGIELGTVKSRLNRSREKLREKIREQNPKIPVKADENK